MMNDSLNATPSWKKQLFLFLSCGVAFSIPFPPISNSIFCIVLFLFWLFFVDKKWSAVRVKKILVISLLFWIALIAMAYTENSAEGLFRLQQKVLLLMLPLVFGTIRWDWRHHAKWISIFFIWGTFGACVICLLNATIYLLLHQHFDYFFSFALARTIDIYPYVQAILCLASILLIAESYMGQWTLSKFFHRRQIAIGFIVFFSLFIFLLSVKQIIFAWIIFVIVYTIRLKTNRKFALALFTFGFLFVLSATIFIPTVREKFYEFISEQKKSTFLSQDPSLNSGWNGIAVRKALWMYSLDAIRKNFWLGVGTGDGQDALQATYESHKFYFASRGDNRFNAHNQYLQVLVNFGVIGFTIWMASVCWLFFSLRSHTLAVYLLGTLLFAMLTESMLETNKGVLAMAFLLSLCSFVSQTDELH